MHALRGRDRGQPVLHRGGRAPHPRHGRRADGGGDARGGGRARRRARGHRAAAAAPHASPRAPCCWSPRVIGREFDYDVLDGGRRRRRGDELVEALEEGVEARVLREVGHVGRYAFTHALVRATLYDWHLAAAARAAARAGRRGAGAPARRRPRPAPGDARAPLRAGGAGRAARTGRSTSRSPPPPRGPAAGLGGGGAALPRRRCGRASWRGARRRPRARRAAARAGRLRGPGGAGGGGARDVPGRDPHRPPARRRGAARARRARRRRAVVGAGALGPGGASPLLDEALEALPEEDSPLRARLLARMSLELYYAGEPELRLSLSRGGGGDRPPHRRPARRSRPASTRATTRCGCRRTSRSGSRWPPSCGAWPRRPATPSSSCRARAGRSST